MCGKDIPPSVDASDSAAKALQQLYPEQIPLQVEDLSQNEQANYLFNQLLEERHKVEQHQQYFDELKHQLQMMMKDAERAVFTGGSVTWKKSQDSISLDSKSFLNSILNIYSSSTNQSRNTALSDLPEWWIEQIRSTIYFLTTYQINQPQNH
jgi:predicted phage-related endonuclease